MRYRVGWPAGGGPSGARGAEVRAGRLEEVEVGVAAGVVVEEGGRGDEVAQLGDHAAEWVSLGREGADDQGDLQAEVGWAGR